MSRRIRDEPRRHEVTKKTSVLYRHDRSASPTFASDNFVPSCLRGSALRFGQVRDELRQLLCRGRLGAADVVAAGRDARAQRLFQREPDHAAEAEAGVEMVA